MGIIRAALQTVTGAVKDQWTEVVEPEGMDDQTLLVQGTVKKSGGGRGSRDVISNGSVIHVYDNQFMILVDGGKVVDYTAEPGYYMVDNSSMPSMFNGQLDESLQEAFNRFRFGGITPMSQKVFYINLQEIRGIKFGTRNPVNYFDNFYNAELFLRAHGTYSVKITNPLLFYGEVAPRDAAKVEIEDINEQFLAEFLEALQTSINRMSADGIRISYDEESQKLIQMRNQGAMMGDPSIREGYMQSAVARGLEAAGSNAAGSAAGYMGMGFGMQAAGAAMSAASAANLQQMQMNHQTGTAFQGTAGAGGASWTCACGTVNTGKFCSECGKPRPAGEWICSCGTANSGKFCSECGKPRP